MLQSRHMRRLSLVVTSATIACATAAAVGWLATRVLLSLS
jgi:hypothetical protein